jgi:cytochrome P450
MLQPMKGERMRLDEVDLTDNDRFVDDSPWQMFDVLRHQDPVHWQPEASPNKGFWALAKHADIVATLRDDETFSSEVGAASLEELDQEQLDVRRSMLETDGARHWALRRLLHKQFTPKAVAHYGTFLRGLTATTLDAALSKGEFDFVKEVSADFPIRVLARMLDVPEGDTPQLIKWGNRMIGHPEAMARLRANPELMPVAVEEFLRWATPVHHFRRTATRDVELRGKHIRAGDKVVVWFGSGNRDEEVFGNPYDFDITREPNDHVTFGKGGPHFCM